MKSDSVHKKNTVRKIVCHKSGKLTSVIHRAASKHRKSLRRGDQIREHQASSEHCKFLVNPWAQKWQSWSQFHVAVAAIINEMGTIQCQAIRKIARRRFASRDLQKIERSQLIIYKLYKFLHSGWCLLMFINAKIKFLFNFVHQKSNRLVDCNSTNYI